MIRNELKLKFLDVNQLKTISIEWVVIVKNIINQYIINKTLLNV